MKCIVFALAGLMLTVGCAHDPNQPAPGLRPDPLTGRQMQNVAIEGIGRFLVAGEPYVEPVNQSQPMRVMVPLRSITDRPLNVQYQFIFMDERGKELRSNQGWVFAHFEPYSQHQVTGVALEDKAAQWRLMVRPAH
jgi:uncharacterized protein YcfL